MSDTPMCNHATVVRLTKGDDFVDAWECSSCSQRFSLGARTATQTSTNPWQFLGIDADKIVESVRDAMKK